MRAYIDPATASYLTQIIAGLVITLSVTAGIFWKKIRAFFLQKKIRRMEQKLGKQTETPAGAPAADKHELTGSLLEEDGVVEIQLEDEGAKDQ